MSHRRRMGIAGVALLAVLGFAGITTAQATDAAWTDRELVTGTVTAATISPPVGLRCTAGLLLPVTFFWTAPTTGPAPTGYRWTVTGGFSGSGTLAANATSLQLSAGLLGLGSGTFSLYTVSPGGWESVAVTGRLSITRVLVDVLTSCSVP